MFRLLRYFSIASAVALIAVTFALVYLYRDNAMEGLVVSAEGQNITLARSFANILWPRFSDYVMTVSETEGDKLRARPETAEIDGALKALTAGLPVLKVKIYNLDGRTIYSSQPGQIGTDKSNNLSFLKSARAGKPASKFSFRENFSAFSGPVMNRYLVESYLPIWGDDDAVEGVFELYTDVTPLVAIIDRRTDKLTFGLLMTFALLYGVLFMVVRHADGILKKQYTDLQDNEKIINAKNAALENEVAEREKAHDNLEQRVEERTSELNQEIQQRIEADEALRNSEARFKDFAEGASDWFWEMDENLRFTYHSLRYFEITGFRPEDKLGTTRTRYVDPADLERDADKWAAHMEDLEARRPFKNFEFAFKAKDGATINARISGTTVFDAEGNFQGYRGTGTDISERKRAEEGLRKARDELETRVEERTRELTGEITERKRAEEGLRASEQRLRDIAEFSSDWFWEMDAELRFSYFSERYAEITGFDPKKRIGTTRNQFSGKSDSAENAEKWAAHMADLEARRPFRNFQYATTASADGSVRHVRISGTPIFDVDGEFLGYRGTGTDITARKKVEQALAEQSMLLETTFESISQGIVVYDKGLRVTAFNQKYVDLCGYPSGFIRLGMPIEKIIRLRAERGDYGPVTDIDALVREHIQARRQGEIAKRERTGSDGTEVVVTRDTMPNGGYVTTFTDITDIKRAEDALRSSEERFRGAVETLQEGFALYDAEDRLVLLNDEYRRLHPGAEDILVPGMHFEDLVRRNIERGTNADAIGREEEHIRERLEQHRDPKGPIVRRLTNGTWFIIKEARTPDGGITVTETDITELKRAEEALKESERTLQERVVKLKEARRRLKRYAKELVKSNEELEQFAFVASHDLQEPLRKVQAFGDRLMKRYSDALGEDGQDYIIRMQDAAGRMQTLIQSLLNFSRVATKGQPFIPVNLNELMKSTLSDLEILIQETGARVKVADLPTIDADPSQMRQLFQNLIGNALKYRQENVPPKIELASEFVSKETGTPKNRHGGLCQIKVIDNGIGFEEQYAERIFGIFQRLHGREQYEGTGVGLAITRKIAERHGGSISANGRPGEGATFTVILPVSHPTSEGD